MEERHRRRLEARLQASGLNPWDQRSIAERCEEWWPSRGVRGEKLSGSRERVPEDMVPGFDEMGQTWLADERMSLLQDDRGEEAGCLDLGGGDRPRDSLAPSV